MNNMKNMNNDYVIRRSQVNSQVNTPTPPQENLNHPTFGDILSKIKSSEGIKFSKHALDRLNSRNIELTDQEMNRINSGMDKAKNKGVREALIMMDNKVFIASVSNKTIITAAIDEQLKESVFTNIDGAVIV